MHSSRLSPAPCPYMHFTGCAEKVSSLAAFLQPVPKAFARERSLLHDRLCHVGAGLGVEFAFQSDPRGSAWYKLLTLLFIIGKHTDDFYFQNILA